MPETIEQRYQRISGEQPHNDDPPTAETNDLHSNVNTMLFLSEIVYSFAILRKKAATEDLIREDLIVPGQTSTETSEGQKKAFTNPLDTKVTVQNAVEFITLNLTALEGEARINSDLFIYGLLALKQVKNGYLQHFDGDYEGKTFVYGLLVNHDQKRITVVFRGSSLLGDWRANFRFFKSQMITPVMLAEELGFGKDKKICVHRGFKNYLMNASGPDDRQKYSHIKKFILELYESRDCDGYGLYLTGHSLGGALSTLMAFNLAASRKISPYLAGKPVVNISFASPYVGGRVWNEAFKTLENAGKIQHIRVSNKNDIVPPIIFTPNYMHTGVHIFLNPKAEDGHEKEYNESRSLLWQWSFKPITNHLLPEYYDRMTNVKRHLQIMTIDEIYAEFSINKTTFQSDPSE